MNCICGADGQPRLHKIVIKTMFTAVTADREPIRAK